VQTARRLLGALEDLVGHEGMYLRGGRYDLAAAVRGRLDPLVNQLVALSTAPGVSALQPRVAALVRLSEVHSTLMAEKQEEFAAEIKRTDRARHRAAQVAPAYVSGPAASVPRFQAAG